LLIGQFGDSEILVYDPSTDQFLGTIDTNGRPIVNPFLWSLEFRMGGTNVDLNSLYFHGPLQQSAGWIVWRNSDRA
jgi:hypothetical protein